MRSPKSCLFSAGLVFVLDQLKVPVRDSLIINIFLWLNFPITFQLNEPSLGYEKLLQAMLMFCLHLSNIKVTGLNRWAEIDAAQKNDYSFLHAN